MSTDVSHITDLLNIFMYVLFMTRIQQRGWGDEASKGSIKMGINPNNDRDLNLVQPNLSGF